VNNSLFFYIFFFLLFFKKSSLICLLASNSSFTAEDFVESSSGLSITVIFPLSLGFNLKNSSKSILYLQFYIFYYKKMVRQILKSNNFKKRLWEKSHNLLVKFRFCSIYCRFWKLRIRNLRFYTF
jgi:hypothetical protein